MTKIKASIIILSLIMIGCKDKKRRVIIYNFTLKKIAYK